MRTPGPMPPRSWSNQEEQRLIALSQTRLGGEEIARLLNRSVSSIYTRAWRLGIQIGSAMDADKREAWVAEMTLERLSSCHGYERAGLIVAGRDPTTQADIARWNALGRRSAA